MNCEGCGAPVCASLFGSWLVSSPVAWLQRVYAGLRYFLIALILFPSLTFIEGLLVTALVSAGYFAIHTDGPAIYPVALRISFINAPSYVAGFVAIIVITAAYPGAVTRPREVLLRRALRVLALFTVFAFVLDCANGVLVDNLVARWTVIGVFLLTNTTFLLLLAYMRCLIGRIPDRLLSAKLTAAAVVYGIGCVLTLVRIIAFVVLSNKDLKAFYSSLAGSVVGWALPIVEILCRFVGFLWIAIVGVRLYRAFCKAMNENEHSTIALPLLAT